MHGKENLRVLKKTLQEDKKLAFGAPEERELRLKYPFANVFIQFPTTGDSISFPAYLKGLQDGFTPTFNSIDVFGRVDPIPVYQNTRRQLTFSLVMPSFNELHAREILGDINTIVKNLYPSYITPESLGGSASSTRIINSPPLIRVKFANLICDYTNPSRGLLGYINGSINITHGLETNGMLLVEKDGDGVIYAKTYEVAFTMSALHEGTPGFDENGNFLDGDMFPYQTETSSANFFQNQSEGASDPNTTGQKPARLPGQNPSSTAQELNKQAKNVLS